MVFFTRFKPPKHSGLSCTAPAANPVQRQYKSMCDINNIVQRAFAGDATVFRAARCVDLSDAPDDLHMALQAQVNARMAYESLSEAVRKEYPTAEQFFAAVQDESQVEKLRSLGVAKPEEVEVPVKVEITNPVTAPAAE